MHLTEELQAVVKPERFAKQYDRPTVTGDKMNLLRVSEADRNELKKLKDAGFPELVNYPTSNIHTFSSNKDLLTL